MEDTLFNWLRFGPHTQHLNFRSFWLSWPGAGGEFPIGTLVWDGECTPLEISKDNEALVCFFPSVGRKW